MALHLPDGTVLPVAQAGPGRLLLKEPAEHPVSEAILRISVGEEITNFPVLLPHGIAGMDLPLGTADTRLLAGTR